MKKLLILAYDYPPYVSVAGLRPFAWQNYLHEYGIHPVVVTRQWSSEYGDKRDYIAASKSQDIVVEETGISTIVRTPYKPNIANRILLKYGETKYKLVRKIISGWYEVMQYMFFVGPRAGLYRGAKHYLKNNQVDAIIATGDPFVLFKYAAALSQKHNIPWIADYRDPWVESSSRAKHFLFKKYYAWRERSFLQSASMITTVSDFLKKKIAQNIKNKPFKIITNGYNPDAIAPTKAIPQASDCLRIAFVGTIYAWHPWKSVVSCFAQFAKSEMQPRFELNFYGINNADEVKEFIANTYPELKTYVKVYPRMKNDLLLKELAKQNMMLLFNYYSFMGTKIYDYMAIERQILFCYSNDAEANELKNKFYPLDEIPGCSTHLQEDLIKETNSGIIIKDKEELLKALPTIYEEFTKHGQINCKSYGYEKYSRKGQTEQLANIIKALQ